MGTILVRDGVVTATDPDGEPIEGVFKTDREAMAAIIAAAKARGA